MFRSGNSFEASSPVGPRILYGGLRRHLRYRLWSPSYRPRASNGGNIRIIVHADLPLQECGCENKLVDTLSSLEISIHCTQRELRDVCQKHRSRGTSSQCVLSLLIVSISFSRAGQEGQSVLNRKSRSCSSRARCCLGGVQAQRVFDWR